MSAPSLELRLHTTSAPTDRPVSWVHTSELADPTPFLAWWARHPEFFRGETLRTDTSSLVFDE